MNRPRLWVLSALALVLPLSAATAADTMIFAAASTTDAVEAVAERFAAAGRGEVTPVFAASSTLAKQIENGAPADLYISADTRWMDYLAERGLIVSDSRVDLLGNQLVLIAPWGSDLAIELTAGASLAQALGDGRLAMGDPDHVPAGRYGKAALESLGLWQAVAPKVARAKDVRAALALVERAEAVAGIVYATDATASDRVRIVDSFPAASHPPIVYPLAIVAGHDGPDARKIYDFLLGPGARAVFVDLGFTVLPTGLPSN